MTTRPTNAYPIDTDLLRRAHAQSGLTLIQLAQRAATTTTRLTRYETGQSTPSIRTLHRLAAALDLNPTQLMRPPDGPPTLVDLRARAGLTQAEVATHLHLPARIDYGHLEIAQTALTHDQATQLATLYAVPAAQITAAYLTGRSDREHHGRFTPHLHDHHVRPLINEAPQGHLLSPDSRQ